MATQAMADFHRSFMRMRHSGPALKNRRRDMKPPLNLDVTHAVESFERWTRLTDAYAKQFFLMHRGDRNARVEALRLARELTRLNRSMSAAY